MKKYLRNAFLGLIVASIPATIINNQFSNYGDRICSYLEPLSDAQTICKKAAKKEAEDGYAVMFVVLWAISASAVGAGLEYREKKSGKW